MQRRTFKALIVGPLLIAVAQLSVGGCAAKSSYYIPPQPEPMWSPMIAVSPEHGCAVGTLELRANAALQRAIVEGGTPARAGLPLLELDAQPRRRFRRSLIAMGAGLALTGVGMSVVAFDLGSGDGWASFERGVATFFAGAIATTVSGGLAIGAATRIPRSFEPLSTDEESDLVVTDDSNGCQAYTPAQWIRVQAEGE